MANGAYPVRLSGEGAARTWALRALERIGVHESDTADLAVLAEPGNYRLLSAVALLVSMKL